MKHTYALSLKKIHIVLISFQQAAQLTTVCGQSDFQRKMVDSIWRYLVLQNLFFSDASELKDIKQGSHQPQ